MNIISKGQHNGSAIKRCGTKKKETKIKNITKGVIMRNWDRTIKIKHLFTGEEDYGSVQKSMNEVADVIDASHLMPPFETKKFRKIPKGDDYFKPVEYANKLLCSWYDYADEYRVWTE